MWKWFIDPSCGETGCPTINSLLRGKTCRLVTPFFAREYHYLNHKFHVAWRGICVAQTWCGVCYGACGSCGMWWCVVCGSAAWYDSLYVPEPNRRPTRWQNDDIIHWKAHVACRQVPTVVNFTSRHVRWNDHSRDDKHTDWLKHCCTIPCWQNVKALKFSLRKMQCCMLHVCQFQICKHTLSLSHCRRSPCWQNIISEI